MRIFVTGDTHGQFDRIVDFVHRFELNEDDIIIILGDVALNYYDDSSDIRRKAKLNALGPKFLCVHGNHEKRPTSVITGTYIEKEVFGDAAYIEEKFPNLVFAKDGSNYKIGNHEFFVIGGAYSVDKYYRLQRGLHWFSDEQPSAEIKRDIEKKINARNTYDIVLSHTCPKKWQPIELFLSGINQSTIDTSMEEWLEKIEERIVYGEWYFGHYHGNKRINDKVRMLFDAFVEIC